MRIQVCYFAALREAVGRPAEVLDIPAGARLADLARLLEARHPAIVAHRHGLRYAVAQRFAEPDTPLAEGVEVALIPPVSGG